MATNIIPTLGFVFVRFMEKEGVARLILPDGQHDPGGDIVIEAIGPDVPVAQKLQVGMKVLLRGDAKVFVVDEKAHTACLDYHNIMCIVDDPEKLPTDAEIDAVANNS